MQRYNGQLINQFPSAITGNAAAGVQVTVRIKSSGAIATLYATNSTSGATLSNPLTTDSVGSYSFYAADGVYTLDFSYSGLPQQVIQLQDVAALQSQFDDALANAGYVPVGTFSAGCTVSQSNGIVSDGVSYWRWDGALPKTVTAGSSPTPTGVGGWFLVSDSGLRGDLGDVNSSVSVAGFEARYLSRIVPTVKTLQATDALYQAVVGFASGQTYGGGIFYYSASESKANHNGYSVIAPEAIAAWDGSQADLATLFNWSGAGSGCFKRVSEFGAISSRQLGASFGANTITTTAANVIAGKTNGAAILSGNTNNIKAAYDGDMQATCIAGGQQNVADGYYNFVGGGKENAIDADIVNYCAIAGGNRNLINGTQAFLSFIGGGRDNVISGATANRCVIGGGALNVISGSAVSRSSIVGGESNQLSGQNAYYALIGGGQFNVINGVTSGHSSIVGGINNSISGSTTTYSFIGGGQLNDIGASTGSHTVIVGGRENDITSNAQYSFIGGGYLNLLNGQRSVICGGYSNNLATTSGTQNFIGGGNANKMLSTTVQNSVIVGGFDNEIGTTGNGTALVGVSILGGEDNIAVGSRASIVGGLGLRADSYLEVVKGTYNSSANPIGGGTPSKTAYTANQIAESLGIGTSDVDRKNAYVWLKNGKQIRYFTPVYADNAAAIAGGEVVGTVYRTATGVLMQVY